jgi:chromate reductase, NAD(P)H dehydrogenase (quinone)
MADGTLNVISICGSLRKASYNAALVRALPALAPADMAIAPAPAWEKFPVYNADIQNSTGFPADVTAWADAIRAADGVIIVSPEYNWSIPGGLKNAIDWASRPRLEGVLRNKTVAVVGASTGQFGALWAQQDLKRILGIAGARVVGTEIPVARAHERFDDEGRLLDGEVFEQLRLHLTTLASEAVAAPERVAA